MLTGTAFTGASAVSFGGTAATGFTVVSATQVTATTPAGSAGAVNVAITTIGGTGTDTGAFTYQAPAPTITSFSPTSGPAAGGTSVTITGTNFTGAYEVYIGFPVVGYTVVSPTEITAVTAALPGDTSPGVGVVVETPGGAAFASTTYTYEEG
jgi:hypothetical protein